LGEVWQQLPGSRSLLREMKKITLRLWRRHDRFAQGAAWTTGRQPRV